MIGAGAGLSASAGFTYTGERFYANFQDFADRYGFADMYAGGFYPYSTPQEYWAYWSRYVYINRYRDLPGPVYDALLRLAEGMDYFVLTTNVDHCFQRAGFDKRRLFYMQGDYGLFQCGEPCCQKTYDNEDVIRQMVADQRGMRVPEALIPHCPACGRPMSMNLRADDTFVEDEGWHAARARYEEFLRQRRGAKVLFLDLGTGGNTPGIIKYPFWRMSGRWKDAAYACVNLGEAFAPEEIGSGSICVDGDIGEVLRQLEA